MFEEGELGREEEGVVVGGGGGGGGGWCGFWDFCQFLRMGLGRMMLRCWGCTLGFDEHFVIVVVVALVGFEF